MTATLSDTYNIPTDSNIKMVYAFNPSYGLLSFHDDNIGFFNIKLDSTTGSCTMLNTA